MTKKSKYGNKKIEHNGILFDSIKELRRYKELVLLQRANKISNLDIQKSFELLPKYTNNQDEKIRAIHYIADFYYLKDGIEIVEDTKGFKTDVYKLKKKMFEHKYTNIIFREM